MSNKETNSKTLKVVGIAAVAIILIAGASTFLFSNQEKSENVFSDTEAGKTLEAYYEAVMGNSEKLEELGIATDVETVKTNVLASSVAADSPLYEQLESYYQDFTVKIISEEEYYDITDGLNKVEIIYEIDVYEYTKRFYEMSDDNNIDKYLTEEEASIFKDYSGDYSTDEKEIVNDKFYDQFYEELEILEPVKKQFKMVMVVDDEGKCDFAMDSSNDDNKEELENFLLSVIDKNPKPEL